MSGMADEMAARIAADEAAGAVPGSVEGAGSSAGMSNTETPAQAPPQQGGPPESIPYARFKEVNDRLAGLRGYEELAQYGYDADSLRRLASFEQQWQADPVGVFKSLATNLDLPQELMDQISGFEPGAGAAPQQAEATAGGNGDYPQPNVAPEDRRRLEYVDRIMARDEESERNAVLDRVLAAWDEMDKEDGIQTSDRTKLTWVAAAAGHQANGGPVHRTVHDLAVAARSARMEERDADLRGVVLPGNANRGTPPALPGSTPAVSAGPVKFANLREASAAAEADLLAGRLSPLQT